MGIRDRIRSWATLPDIPQLADSEQLLFDAQARRLPIGLAGKYDYGAFGRLLFTDRRLLYLARFVPRRRDDLGDVRITWQAVTGSVLHRGPRKFLLAPRPYVGWLSIRHPIFTLTRSNGDELRFQIWTSEGWRPAIDQLRILYPELDPLASR